MLKKQLYAAPEAEILEIAFEDDFMQGPSNGSGIEDSEVEDPFEGEGWD